MKKILTFLLFALALPAAALAQQTSNAITVATCGTAPFTYTAGQPAPIVQDVNGKLCVNAIVTPGGTQNVNPGTAANWNTTWAGGTLGAMALYGTSPGAVLVPGVNAYVTSIAAGQNGIGNVGGKTVSVCVTPTVTISNSYGTNYVIGGLLTFANAFTSTGSGILQGAVVTIHEVETSGFTFFPFSANPTATTWTDAAVAAINTADVAKVRNPVALGANSQLASSGFTVASAVGLGEALAPGTTSLYGVLIANAALTTQFAATTDVQVCIKVLDDL